MNPLLSPRNLFPIGYHYLFDPGRVTRYSPQRMARYRDKALRRMVRYAATVPFYQEKFAAAKVDVASIRGIEDIGKLPFSSKEEFVRGFPDKMLPKDYRRQTMVVSTGGSTGKHLSMYTDFTVATGGIGAGVRVLTRHHLHPRRTRYVSIGNFQPGKPDAVGHELLTAHAQSVGLVRNMRQMSAFTPMPELMKALDEFDPQVLYSYPTTLQHLAMMKQQGAGEHLNPSLIVSGGCILDSYARKTIVDAFQCPVINSYGSTEGGTEAAIAFECLEGIWHVNHDFFHLEAIDANQHVLPDGERGRIVMTRLYGQATPVIRYTGMEDWISLCSDYDCSCGLRTPTLQGGVEGRLSNSIVTPDGRVYPAASFADVHLALMKLGTQKVSQFQIIQNSLTDIEIDLVFDEKLRSIGPSVETVIEEIRRLHQEKTGSVVKITVREVSSVSAPANKPAPLIISKLCAGDREKVLQRESTT
jgi:phenylacetate-CoA ligase